MLSSVYRPLIQNWRKLYEIKQTELAREAGVHEITLSKIENGAMEPKITTALRICAALSKLSGRDVVVEHLFYCSDEGSDVAQGAYRRASSDLGDGLASPPRSVSHPRLEYGPFRAWLLWVMERDGMNIRETARKLGISDKTAREVLKRRRDVNLATVERALIADNSVMLGDLYPDM